MLLNSSKPVPRLTRDLVKLYTHPDHTAAELRAREDLGHDNSDISDDSDRNNDDYAGTPRQDLEGVSEMEDILRRMEQLYEGEQDSLDSGTRPLSEFSAFEGGIPLYLDPLSRTGSKKKKMVYMTPRHVRFVNGMSEQAAHFQPKLLPHLQILHDASLPPEGTRKGKNHTRDEKIINPFKRVDPFERLVHDTEAIKILAPFKERSQIPISEDNMDEIQEALFLTQNESHLAGLAFYADTIGKIQLINENVGEEPKVPNFWAKRTDEIGWRQFWYSRIHDEGWHGAYGPDWRDRYEDELNELERKRLSAEASGDDDRIQKALRHTGTYYWMYVRDCVHADLKRLLKMMKKQHILKLKDLDDLGILLPAQRTIYLLQNHDFAQLVETLEEQREILHKVAEEEISDLDSQLEAHHKILGSADRITKKAITRIHRLAAQDTESRGEQRAEIEWHFGRPATAEFQEKLLEELDELRGIARFVGRECEEMNHELGGEGTRLMEACMDTHIAGLDALTVAEVREREDQDYDLEKFENDEENMLSGVIIRR